jgi:hypothetical protein
MADLDLNAPEVKEAIKLAVQEATEGLAQKNKELLGELKTARKSLEIKPEDLDKVERERDELAEKLANTDKLYKETLKTTEKIKQQYEQESKFTHGLLVDNGLNDVLVKNGVSNPAMLKAVKSMLASQVKIEAEGESRVAKIGDKALADFVSEWSKSDEGKFFVTANNNTGGGAQGGSGSNSAKQMTRAQFDAADQVTRSAFAKEGGKVVD